MARTRKLGDFVYNYVLDHFRVIHEQANTPTVVKQDLPLYKNVSEIIRGILDDSLFFDIDEYRNDKKPTTNQIEISKNTIRNAIKRLIADKKIVCIDGYWEYLPPVESALNSTPILDIASKTNITVNVPNSYLVLTVNNGLAACVAEYLSAQFYKGDIIFIPLGNHIICIGTFSESSLKKELSEKNILEFSSTAVLLDRITSVLHNFQLTYPQFSAGIHYETAYTASHNPNITAQIREMAFDKEKKRLSYHRYMMLMKMFRSLPLFEEYQTLSNIFGPLEVEHDGISDEEWDLMDSPITDSVDDELEEFQ